MNSANFRKFKRSQGGGGRESEREETLGVLIVYTNNEGVVEG